MFVLSTVRMLPEREIGVRFSGQNSLRVGEFAETPFAMVRPHTRVSRTVEGHALDHHMDTDLIDTTSAKLLRLHHTVCPLLIFCEDIRQDTVHRISYQKQQVLFLGDKELLRNKLLKDAQDASSDARRRKEAERGYVD